MMQIKEKDIWDLVYQCRNTNLNFQEHLSASLNKLKYDKEIIASAYDLQTGCYIESYKSDRGWYDAYQRVLSKQISKIITTGDSILDAGAGELNNSMGIFKNLENLVSAYVACDASFSRLNAGYGAFESAWTNKFGIFCSYMSTLPLSSSSVDWVFTSHGLEPNNEFASEILSEFSRVAAKGVILFEPDYENSSEAAKARMDKLKFVKNIPKKLESAGFELIEHIPLEISRKKVNPTSCFVAVKKCRKAPSDQCGNLTFTFPGTDCELTNQDSGLHSLEYSAWFPVLKNIPILRRDKAIFHLGE